MTRCNLWTCGLFFFLSLASLSALQIGDEVPGFSVVSGNGSMLIREDLRNKTTFLFYDNRSLLDTNEDLKRYLKDMKADSDTALTAVVVDCSDVGLFKRVWQERLSDHSRRTGLSVYGDWNGKMKRSFSYGDDKAYFLVIDKNGTVVYAEQGQISSSDFGKIGAFLE